MLIITIDTYISIIYQKSERKRSRMKGMAWSPLGNGTPDVSRGLWHVLVIVGHPLGVWEEKVATTCIENRKTVAW